MRMKLAWAFLAAVLAGCSSPNFVGRPDLTVVNGAGLPPPTVADLGSQERAYVIGPSDRVGVEVFGISELSRNVLVDANGEIALPLVGNIPAAGKTPVQLAAEIEGRLRSQHVRNPQVTVNILEAVSQTVTVDGAVMEPGIYPILGRMTLIRSIARAKGVTEFARQNHVVVFRRVGEQNMAALYDLRAIRLGMYEDPQIYANDVVVVGESQARRLFRDALQGAGLITAPIVALIQQ